MTSTPAPNHETQLEAVLQAALYLLGARQDQMLTIEEWTDLARAVAACPERKRDTFDISGTSVTLFTWDSR